MKIIVFYLVRFKKDPQKKNVGLRLFSECAGDLGGSRADLEAFGGMWGHLGGMFSLNLNTVWEYASAFFWETIM